MLCRSRRLRLPTACRRLATRTCARRLSSGAAARHGMQAAEAAAGGEPSAGVMQRHGIPIAMWTAVSLNVAAFFSQGDEGVQILFHLEEFEAPLLSPDTPQERLTERLERVVRSAPSLALRPAQSDAQHAPRAVVPPAHPAHTRSARHRRAARRSTTRSSSPSPSRQASPAGSSTSPSARSRTRRRRRATTRPRWSSTSAPRHPPPSSCSSAESTRGTSANPHPHPHLPPPPLLTSSALVRSSPQAGSRCRRPGRGALPAQDLRRRPLLDGGPPRGETALPSQPRRATSRGEPSRSQPPTSAPQAVPLLAAEGAVGALHAAQASSQAVRRKKACAAAPPPGSASAATRPSRLRAGGGCAWEARGGDRSEARPPAPARGRAHPSLLTAAARELGRPPTWSRKCPGSV